MRYREIATSYLVLPPELFEKQFQVVCPPKNLAKGWTQTGFVNWAIADFFRVNIDYYLEAGKLDAEARGYQGFEGDYYQDLLEDNLEPWANGLRPRFEDSPLRQIVDAKEARKNQHRLKQIRVSEYNAALIRLALEIDDLTLIQLTSRIVIWHFWEYWDAKGGYQWQIDGAESETLEP
ncbi:MAG: hypothetical protein AAGF93_00460 [Cyanobacteria bacterium P01_H01_bin.105]